MDMNPEDMPSFSGLMHLSVGEKENIIDIKNQNSDSKHRS